MHWAVVKTCCPNNKSKKQPVLNLPHQSAGSNDCGVFVCAFMENSGLIINWDELHEICKTQRSEKNRKAIRERIEFFRVDREPVTRWCNSSFKMAERIKKEEPKQMKEKARKVYTSSFWNWWIQKLKHSILMDFLSACFFSLKTNWR